MGKRRNRGIWGRGKIRGERGIKNGSKKRSKDGCSKVVFRLDAENKRTKRSVKVDLKRKDDMLLACTSVEDEEK